MFWKKTHTKQGKMFSRYCCQWDNLELISSSLTQLNTDKENYSLAWYASWKQSESWLNLAFSRLILGNELCLAIMLSKLRYTPRSTIHPEETTHLHREKISPQTFCYENKINDQRKKTTASNNNQSQIKIEQKTANN